jgi:fructose-specific phosphotransferase system component IIB
VQVAQKVDITRTGIAVLVLDQEFPKDKFQLVSRTHQSQTHVTLSSRAQLIDHAPHLKTPNKNNHQIIQ